MAGLPIAQAQISQFRAFKNTSGVVTHNSNGLYVWKSWGVSSTLFSFDMQKKMIIVNENGRTTEYEIFDKPKKWVVKQNYKYLLFECMNKVTLEEVYIRLCQYDASTFKITVMQPKAAERYQVRYIKGYLVDADSHEEETNFDDVDE